MQSAILFTNWSNEAFTHTYNKEEFKFQPGQTIYLQEYLAKHFAKHLANRELLKTENEKYVAACGNESSLLFQEYLNRALSSPVEAESSLKAEIEEMNLNAGLKRFCEFCDSKGVRHKKDCPSLTPVSNSSEEEFAGLKE